ncbi:tetratricopeptide repeat protein [Streptomyces hydrogenans]|uniref:tetratricopeptide repeat protein n=1 Tax=Streptomyces hydrogenans TaxID=1873719 RepID=UPI0035E13D7B
MNDIRTRAEALLAAGRAGEARTAARDALDADGPDAGLFLVLARAHMAEDDDSHDDAAERAFREGLDAFPDHLGLLGGYAELCARTDAFERPGRSARGRAIAARLRELAPHSAELRRVEAAGSSVRAGAKDAVSVRRVQSFDAATAFAAAATPAEAAERTARWAAQAPYDRRLAVLAETTAALAAPGRTLPRLMLCRAAEYRLLGAALVALLVVLRVTVLPVPSGVTVAVLVLLSLPDLALRRLLGRARERAAARAADAVPAETETVAEPEGFGAPELQPVPRLTRREAVFAGAAVALALVAGGVAYTSSLAYPRYQVVAHDEFRGARGVDLGSLRGAEQVDGVEESMLWMYGPATGNDDGEQLVVYAAAGDLHGVRAQDVSGRYGMLGGLEETVDVREDWAADAGERGGWMHCARIAEPDQVRKAVCMWADRGSLGSVGFVAEHMGRAEIEALAADVRAAFLRPVGD